MGTDIAIIDKQTMLQAFSMSPIQYCKSISNNITTIRQVLDSPSITLLEINNHNSTQLNAVLTKFIEGMLEFHGRDRKSMNNYQVLKIIEGIIQTYHYFTLEDVCLCFKMARNNSYYKGFYGIIDGKVIMQWFANYDKERSEICNSLVNNIEVRLTGEELTEDEYEGFLLSRMAAGDENAIGPYNARKEREKYFKSISRELARYKYNQKHKYDDKPKRVLGRTEP